MAFKTRNNKRCFFFSPLYFYSSLFFGLFPLYYACPYLLPSSSRRRSLLFFCHPSFFRQKNVKGSANFPFPWHKHSLANIYKKTPQGTIVTLRSFGERNQIQTLRYLIWFGFSRLRLIKSGGGRGGPGLKHPDTTHMFAAR